MSSEFSAGDRSEHRLRWALGAVMLWRLLFPYFDSPLTHLFSDPARHWANGGRFLDPDLMGAGDPYLYQLWLYFIRTVSADDPATVIFSCGLLCAAMPYGWYRALRELLPRKQALAGAVTIGLVPGFFGIYAYFMNETLLLTLSGFAFWFTLRAWRKATLASWALACGLWACAVFTRAIALPMAFACLAALWIGQPQRLERAVIAAVSFALFAIPAGMHGYTKLGFFSPLGNVHMSEIYSLSGYKNIDLDMGAAGRWGFGSPSFYNPTFFPLSNWTTDRQGTVAVKIDLTHGVTDWIAERERVRRENPLSRWQRYKENLIYLLFGQSWPDNDPHALSGRLAVWTRWVWSPLMLYVLWGVWQHRFHGQAWLLPACSLGMLLFLALQGSGIVEGRYVKPLHPILLAAAIVLYTGQLRVRVTSAMSDYDSAFFDYVNTTARESAERIVPLLNTELHPKSVLDVGCGQGAWLATWRSQDIDLIFGVDGNYVDKTRLLVPTDAFRALDLKNGFDLGISFDFVQCLEVAEHVPASRTDQFLDSLTRHGQVILFSAAPPGQGGHDHLNERSYEYWRRQFARRQYLVLDCLRPRIRSDQRIAPWYRYNSLLYVHAEKFPELSPALQASRIPDGVTVADLAPLIYRVRRQIVRRLPVSLMTAIARVKERLVGRKSSSGAAPREV